MKISKVAWMAILGAAIGLFGFAAPAAWAEDADGDGYDDIYVSPQDDESSDEAARENAGSGFDTPGSFYIDEDDYDAGAGDDGTWSPDVPETSPPEPVDEGE